MMVPNDWDFLTTPHPLVRFEFFGYDVGSTNAGIIVQFIFFVGMTGAIKWLKMPKKMAR